MRSTHLDDAGRPLMVDVSEKAATIREAEAEGIVVLTPLIREAIRTNSVSKGDVFRVAEVAGIMAAKRTPEIIPLCHSIRLDHARVVCGFDADDDGEAAVVRVNCVVRASDVTGVEMEALTGVSVACLTIYDMCKGMDKGITIGDIRLLRKSGGKSGDYSAGGAESRGPGRVISAGILTVSDKGFAGERADTSGGRLAELLRDFGAEVKRRAIVPDETEDIAACLKDWADNDRLELILTTGGTGLSPRDVTPEALSLVGDRTVPGIGEHMRARSMAQTPNGILSRGTAVTRGGSLIISLPGSERGAGECFQSVRQSLRHAVEILNGLTAECGSQHSH